METIIFYAFFQNINVKRNQIKCKTPKIKSYYRNYKIQEKNVSYHCTDFVFKKH